MIQAENGSVDFGLFRFSSNADHSFFNSYVLKKSFIWGESASKMSKTIFEILCVNKKIFFWKFIFSMKNMFFLFWIFFLLRYGHVLGVFEPREPFGALRGSQEGPGMMPIKTVFRLTLYEISRPYSFAGSAVRGSFVQRYESIMFACGDCLVR